MKLCDLLVLSLKSLKSKKSILLMIGLAISSFCFLVSGNSFFIMWKEKALPCELSITSESLTDASIAQLLKIDDILNTTATMEVPVNLTVGEYSAKLMATGIDEDYLAKTKGLIFPSSSMPNFIMNEAAIKMFADANGKTLPDENQVDWENTQTTIEQKTPIVARIYSILSDGEEAPLVYMELGIAKNLMRSSGETFGYSSVLVQLPNSGLEAAVTKKISKLGFEVQNVNQEQISRWEKQEFELIYLMLSGLFSLVCTCCISFLYSAQTVVWRRDLFHYLGFADSDVDNLLLWEVIYLFLAGFVLGVLINRIVILFTPFQMDGMNSFTLPIQIQSLLALLFIDSFAVCIQWLIHKRQYEADITKFYTVADDIAKENSLTNLKRIRTAANITQEKLAIESDVSIRSIQMYEQRNKDINKAQAITLAKISRVLGCEVEDLLEQESEGGYEK